MKAKERRAKSEESFYSLCTLPSAPCSCAWPHSGRIHGERLATEKEFQRGGGDYVGMIQREADFRFT